MEIEKKAERHGKTFLNLRKAANAARELRMKQTESYIRDLLDIKDAEIKKLKGEIKALKGQGRLL